MTRAAKNCPFDRDVMTRFTVFDTDLEQCPTCHGIWFDAGELDRLKTRMNDDVRWKEIDLAAYAARTQFKPTKLACPACGRALCDLRFDDTRIQLEFCPACHGVWLDKGKLERILHHLRRKADREPLAQTERETLHQFLEIFVGPKGPWEEMKDFGAAWRLLTLKFAVDHPDLMARLELARRALPF